MVSSVFVLIVVARAGIASAQDADSRRSAAAGSTQAARLGAGGPSSAEAAEAEPIAGSAGSSSRAAVIEQAQAAKAVKLAPAAPGKAEAYVTRLSDTFLSGQLHWHAFWQNAYSGGGFTLGAGYMSYVSSYNLARCPRAASRSPGTSGSRRSSSRRSCLRGAAGCRCSAAGARRRRSISTDSVRTRSMENLANYGFTQPYLGANLEVFPTKKLFTLAGGVEVSQWNQGAGSGSSPSIEQKYTPETLPGLGASPVYLHTQATVGLDSRPARGYTRRGGFYGVTVHDYTDKDGAFGFNQVDYDGDPAHPDPARGLGARVPRVRADDLRQERPADSVLHDAVVQRRLRPARATRAGASAT